MHAKFQKEILTTALLLQNFNMWVSFLIFWFGLLLYVPGNSYGYVGTVSSPNHFSGQA